MNIQEILLGIAIGDAYGAGLEFQDRDWIRKHVDFSRFVNARSSIQVPTHKLKDFTENYHPWDYTDDTEMTIGVIKALIAKAPFNQDLLVEKWKEEYQRGIQAKGFGRNGHGSMRWYYSGQMTIEEIRDFQRNRPNPGNAPAMRAVPVGLLPEEFIDAYARINAEATHPNVSAILSSQYIARSVEFLIGKRGAQGDLIRYCLEKVSLNEEYRSYLSRVDQLGSYEDLRASDLEILCGPQPIEEPYFLPGIKGVPSDAKYTTGSVLYLLKNSLDAMDALKKSIGLGGDVDSLAS
ncbi:MAG: ADP-ribosylglycohydrolase family protein, partial [Bacteroidota bacterium]